MRKLILLVLFVLPMTIFNSCNEEDTNEIYEENIPSKILQSPEFIQMSTSWKDYVVTNRNLREKFHEEFNKLNIEQQKSFKITITNLRNQSSTSELDDVYNKFKLTNPNDIFKLRKMHSDRDLFLEKFPEFNIKANQDLLTEYFTNNILPTIN